MTISHGHQKCNASEGRNVSVAPTKAMHKKATNTTSSSSNSAISEAPPDPYTPANPSSPQQPQNNDNVAEPPLLPSSKLSRLSALGRTDNSDDEIRQVGSFLRRGSLVAVCLWVILLGLVYVLAPVDSYETLQGPERHANLLVFVLLFVSNGSRLLPILLRDRRTKFLRTGAMIGSCTIQCIAMASVGLMTWCSTPVMVDPITQQRVVLVRWVEWIPLAFLMTFLTEGMDLPNQQQQQQQQQQQDQQQQPNSDTRVAWWHAWAIALSTSAGLLFPFCPNLAWWMALFVISCILFLSLYIRLYQRTLRYRNADRGSSVDQQERYERVRCSLRLLQACAFMWTFLVVAFTFTCLAPMSASEDSWMAHPALPLVTENICEIGSKVWYLMLIVDVHEQVFDEASRAVRRLEELRSIISVVWDSSSDVICLCLRGHDGGGGGGASSPRTIKAIVSPTFLRMSGVDIVPDRKNNVALVFEVTLPSSTKNKDNNNDGDNTIPTHHQVFAIHMSEPVTQANVRDRETLLDQYVNKDPMSTDQRNLSSMALLIAKTAATTSHANDDDNNDNNKETLLMHVLYGRNGSNGGSERTIRCEAKITPLENNATVIVLRDISERFQRFEAEKQLVVEVTERKKDAEANRFTRHEVKNGLLAAIGLVDSMRESLTDTTPRVDRSLDISVPKDVTLTTSSATRMIRRIPSNLSMASSREGVESKVRPLEMGQGLLELDSTLREVLDTVMSEAMARDVVHEVYEPRRERVDVLAVLSGFRGKLPETVDRFPLVTEPTPFPQLIIDQQLLRHIHRNAVSNACKYGQDGGVVTTKLLYDRNKKTFRMDIVNLPGDNHADLVALSYEETQKVFAAGTRLGVSQQVPPLEATSSGDGAWIMQKCANTLGGQCTIDFQTNSTVFSFTCSAEAYIPNEELSSMERKPSFQLPPTVWGIAIDDSLVQRKLLSRYLSLVGVSPKKRKVLGKDSEELLGFNDFLLKTIKEHPDDKFLVIVDENLDIRVGNAHEKTVSGSSCVELLRKQMDPEDESRMFALIRSANDSAEDVAVYKRRAHGFLPKAPIQKDRVLEQLEPLWEVRFPEDDSICSGKQPSVSSGADNDGFQISSEDLVNSLEVIDALCGNGNKTLLEARWPAIRERLHALKGDIKSMNTNARISTVLEALEKLRGESLPEELVERWKLIRSLIVSVL